MYDGGAVRWGMHGCVWLEVALGIEEQAGSVVRSGAKGGTYNLWLSLGMEIQRHA